MAEQIVYALKYDGWRTLGAEIGERIARVPWPDDVRLERTALVPVPLSAQRLRERGYNQSSLLAGHAEDSAVVLCVGVAVEDPALLVQDRTQLRDHPRIAAFGVVGNG